MAASHHLVYHNLRGEGYSTVRCFERIKERNRIHMSIITMYCYDHSIFLLVTAVHLLLCLIYKLNFIASMHVQKSTWCI